MVGAEVVGGLFVLGFDFKKEYVVGVIVMT